MTTTTSASIDLHQIRRYARGALNAAGALDLIPAPLPQITTAVGLHREDLFALGEDLPPRMLAIAMKLSGKLLGALAIREKTLYIDPTMKFERERFTQAHEIGHNGLPWHADAYYADDDHTLAFQTRQQLEREANGFAAEIIFGLDRFTEQVDSYRFDLEQLLAIARQHQASAHAALWRYAETTRHSVALLTLGRFPLYRRTGTSLKVLSGACVQSSSFADRYGPIADIAPDTFTIGDHEVIKTVHDLERGADSEVHELRLDTKRGPITFDAFPFAGYLNLVLLARRRRVRAPRAVILERSG